MLSYEATALVEASPAIVWSVVIDGGAYTAWDSGITEVRGSIVDGGRLTVITEASGGRAFPVTVSLDHGARVMTWRGGMPLGLFRGVRTFSVDPAPAGSPHPHRAVLRVREVFDGLLLGLVRRSMPDLQPGFDRYVSGAAVRAAELAGPG